MGTDVSIVMCYRDFGDPWRQKSFEYCRPRYEQMAAELGGDFVLDTSEGGHAKAINAGVRAAKGDVIALVDSDSLVPTARMAEALQLAETPGLVVPHTRYVYLNQRATFDVLERGEDPFGPVSLQYEFCGPGGVGNVVVFSRDTWATSGGYDERFYAWGGDDTCFHIACEALIGPTRRMEGDVIHLWHARTPDEYSGRRAPDIQAVLDAYVDAERAGREAVLDYLATR